MNTTQTLRPGLLVSLKTSVRGNVSYDKRDLQSDTRAADGAAVAKWETVRTITDPVEHEAAGKARGEASSKIRSVCARSAFGLLCPEADADVLEQAIREARKIADAFNDTAKLSRLSIYVITGRIAADDVEAMRAINSEVAELLDQMKVGIETLDVKSIRDAAGRMREMGQMLSPEMEARTKLAIDAAREAAKKIVKAGEQAAQEIDRSAIRRITEARTAFLDLSGDGGDVAQPKAQSRAIDMTPEDDKPATRRKAAARAIEL